MVRFVTGSRYTAVLTVFGIAHGIRFSCVAHDCKRPGQAVAEFQQGSFFTTEDTETQRKAQNATNSHGLTLSEFRNIVSEKIRVNPRLLVCFLCVSVSSVVRLVFPAPGIPADLEHLEEHPGTIAQGTDARPRVMCPRHGNFHDLEPVLLRDKKNFRIESPALDSLQRKNRHRRPPGKRFKAALRVLELHSKQNSQ